MSEFFRGWQRKLGVVTLMMACLFTMAWVRGDHYVDSVRLLEGRTWYSLKSFYGRMWFVQAQSTSVNPTLPRIAIGTWSPFLINTDGTLQRLPAEQLVDVGLEYGVGLAPGTRIYSVPYWFITTQLTLISIWLLLSKPRKSNQKKAIEPVPTHGA